MHPSVRALHRTSVWCRSDAVTIPRRTANHFLRCRNAWTCRSPPKKQDQHDNNKPRNVHRLSGHVVSPCGRASVCGFYWRLRWDTFSASGEKPWLNAARRAEPAITARQRERGKRVCVGVMCQSCTTHTTGHRHTHISAETHKHRWPERHACWKPCYNPVTVNSLKSHWLPFEPIRHKPAFFYIFIRNYENLSFWESHAAAQCRGSGHSLWDGVWNRHRTNKWEKDSPWFINLNLLSHRLECDIQTNPIISSDVKIFLPTSPSLI